MKIVYFKIIKIIVNVSGSKKLYLVKFIPMGMLYSHPFKPWNKNKKVTCK